MAHAMVIQLPVASAFGTDEDFDLRTQLERELGAALAAEGAGECGRGGIEGGRMSVCLESVTDPVRAFQIVKDVLARRKLLARAAVILETRCEIDPDDIDRQTLWPVQLPAPTRVA